MNKLMFALLFLLLSCSRTQLLGFKEHEFRAQPRHIIWLQVAGLSEEHLAMLRFATLPNEKKTVFEGATCFGKVWNYHFYELRPSSERGFFSQIVGKDTIKGECSDYAQTPLWKILDELNYKTYLFEGPNSSLGGPMGLKKCAKEAPSYLMPATFWTMTKAPKKESPFFHFQDRNLEGIEKEGIYYDRACQEGPCFSSYLENAKNIYRKIFAEKRNYLYILRDFSFEQALKDGKIGVARELLSELEKLTSYFLKEAENDPRLLVLVTSSAPLPIEYPDQGGAWADFESKGKNILYKKTSLTAPVFAFGSGSENFCGFYSESDIFMRLLWFKTNRDKRGVSFW